MQRQQYTCYPGEGKGAGNNQRLRALAICDLEFVCLRLRLDLLIAGEIRDMEAYELLQALNTGHSEAKSAQVLSRLIDLCRMEWDL